MDASEDGLRIGELAEIAGVSTRTIRHYHRIGLLAEPARGANGYRRYGLADTVRLLRVRRLAEFGLRLDEVADTLADDSDKELRDVLAQLDADLARQAQAIATRRTRIAELLGRADDLALPGGLGELLDEWRRSAEGHPAAERESEVIELVGSLAGEAAPEFFAAYRRLLATPAVLEPALLAYRRFEALVEVGPDDPGVQGLADDIAALLPALAPVLCEGSEIESAPSPAAALIRRAVEAGLAPSQRRALELVFASTGPTW